jgi:adenylate cyclase
MREFNDAIHSGSRALELNPNLAFAYGALAHAYSCLGDYDNTVLHAERAERLSPRDPACLLWYMSQSCVAILTHRYEESVEWARKMIEANSNFAPAWNHLAADYALLGRPDEARRAIQQLRQLAPDLSDESSLWARVPYAPQMREGMERYVEGVRKAGLLE